jgi:hypothetical protein
MGVLEMLEKYFYIFKLRITLRRSDGLSGECVVKSAALPKWNTSDDC